MKEDVHNAHAMRHRVLLSLVVACIAALPTLAGAQRDSLRLYYVGRPVGWEHYAIEPTAGGLRHSADFEYVDRGRRIHLASATAMDSGFAPSQLDVYRVNDTSRTIATRVILGGG
ncbi:MAG: hypothetical protein JWM95_1327, partial [Gemmatimonadetes bacterium]|nr:hypothetical protein [Gemmatimonadota bacterium]